MTATDQPAAADARCRCGCPKWDHKQGRSICKTCGCDLYDPAAEPQLAKLRAQVHQLEQAVGVITSERDTARSEANDAANKTARLRLRVEHLERETTHAQAQVDEARGQRDAAQTEGARLREQLADAEAALVEANEARRMRAPGEQLHERIAAAALVIARDLRWMCLHCGSRYGFDDADHRCGPLIPVDVIVARRPNPPTTEEQP